MLGTAEQVFRLCSTNKVATQCTNHMNVNETRRSREMSNRFTLNPITLIGLGSPRARVDR